MEYTPPRRESRLRFLLPIQVRSDQRQDVMNLCSLDISSTGAKITTAGYAFEIGQSLVITRKDVEARFRVVWVGTPEKGNAGQIGVHCVDEDVNIWTDEGGMQRVRMANA